MFSLKTLSHKQLLLNNNFNLFYQNKSSILYLKGLYGIVSYKLPSFYFWRKNINNLTFIFLNKFFFSSFLRHFFMFYKRLYYIYSVRLKIRGLGYRIRRISNNLYYFFFNYTNMYYFYIPNNILFKWYKKRAVLLSSNFFLLKLLFSQILLLKKIGPYRLRGLRYPRQIIFIKKGGKKF